jgi:hypothetical protein
MLKVNQAYSIHLICLRIVARLSLHYQNNKPGMKRRSSRLLSDSDSDSEEDRTDLSPTKSSTVYNSEVIKRSRHSTTQVKMDTRSNPKAVEPLTIKKTPLSSQRKLMIMDEEKPKEKETNVVESSDFEDMDEELLSETMSSEEGSEKELQVNTEENEQEIEISEHEFSEDSVDELDSYVEVDGTSAINSKCTLSPAKSLTARQRALLRNETGTREEDESLLHIPSLYLSKL